MPNASIDEIQRALSNLERRGRLKIDQAVPRFSATRMRRRQRPFWDIEVTAPHLASDAQGRTCARETLVLRVEVDSDQGPGRLRFSALGEPLPVHPRFAAPSLHRSVWREGPTRAAWQIPYVYRDTARFPELLQSCLRDVGFVDEGLADDELRLWRERHHINRTLLNEVQQQAAAALEGVDFAKDAETGHTFRVRDDSASIHPGREADVQRPPYGARSADPAEAVTVERPPPKFRVREESESSEVAHATLPKPRAVHLQSRVCPSRGPTAFIPREAADRIFRHIGWRDHGRSDNRVEQGGILIGRSFFDPDAGVHFAIADDVIAAEGAIGSAGYLSMTHDAWRTMFERFDQLVAEGRIDSASYIVGWYHTHPNSLDVFMSGTDRHTQRRYFAKDWQCAVVLNPHREIWDVFFGAQCRQGRGLICDL